MNSKIILNIKNELERNSQTINKLLQIDNQYCKIRINLQMLKNILDKSQNEKIDIQTEQKILIRYNGNPCITINLIVIAILTQNTLILDCGGNMIGTNKFIIEMANGVLKDFQKDKQVYLSNQNQEDVDKIIYIDDINKYNSYLREKNSKAKFYSFNYIDFYSDSEEFEEITELIYSYAEENQIPVESYSELDIDEAIQMIGNGLGKNVVILTNNKETKEKFQRSIPDKKIYINKNPFEQDTKILGKEILYI